MTGESMEARSSKSRWSDAFEVLVSGAGGETPQTLEFRAAGAKRLESSGCADCRSPSVLIQVT